MTLGVNKVNLTDLTAEQNTFYVRTLLERLLGTFPHRDYGQKTVLGRNQGLGVEWRRFNSLTAATTALTEGTPPAESSFTITQIYGSVVQYGAYLAGTDVVMAGGKDKVLLECADLLGEQMGLSLDQITRDVLAAGTTVQYAGVAGSRGQIGSGNLITAAEVREAVRTLKRNNVRPINGRYIAIIHPDTWHDLMADTNIVNAVQYHQNDNLFTGKMPEWMGVGFVESTNAKVWSGLGLSAADIYATLVLGANAYGILELSGETVDYIYNPPGSAGASDPLRQRWTAGWKAMFAATIIDQSAMVRIEHAATYKILAP